ncbi:MAG: hypothetical protein FWG93_03380 [Oscillospiraceae bacterium]|nr:hypothetical protein [Oscillospiraceae bacterium]
MPGALIAVISFFAALGIAALVWVAAALVSAPGRGSKLYLLSAASSAGALEDDLRRASWLRKAGELQVTLVLLDEGLPEDLRRVARRREQTGEVRLLRREEIFLLFGA